MILNLFKKPALQVILAVTVGFPLLASAASLTEFDRHILKDYTQAGYFISNAVEERLDTGTAGLKGPLFTLGVDPTADDRALQNYRYFTQLNAALDKLPVYGEVGKTIVYRGIYHSQEHGKIEERFFKGRVWNERRYSSATTSREVAKKFALGAYKNEGCGGCPSSVEKPDVKNAVIISILNSTGREISKFAADATEKEVLFKSGTLFKCVEAGRDEFKRYIVKLIELDAAKLSPEDKKALAQSEKIRFDALAAIRYGGADSAKSLQHDVKVWNAAYATWRAQSELDKPYVFDDEEGGD